jgi:hypothetical protein
MPSRVPDVVFGPEDLALVQFAYDELLDWIAHKRSVSEEDRLRVAHVVFEYAKLGVLDPGELRAHAIAEVQQPARSADAA